MFGNYMDQNYQLISEVKKHRLLWDPKFRDLTANAQVWNQIAKTVKLPARACRDRFKNLRDTYLRILKKNSKENSDSKGTERRCKWAYFKEMQFLLEVLDQKLTSNGTSDTFEDLSADNEENGDIVIFEEAQSSEDGIIISEVLDEEEILIGTRNFADVEDSSSMTSNFDDVVTSKTKRGRVTSKRKNQENELFKKFKRFQKWENEKCKSKNADRAQLFADSLVNHLERVPNELWGLCTLQMTQLAVMFSNGVIPQTLINPMSTTTSEVPVILLQNAEQT